MEVELRIINVYYPLQESVNKIWVRENCPSVEIERRDAREGTVIVWFNESMATQRTINLSGDTSCFNSQNLYMDS
jgi:hypothetical protein